MSTHTAFRSVIIYKVIDGIRYIEKCLIVVCAVVYLAMMVLGTADVAGRYLFNSPIPGTLELSSVMMGAVVLFGWAYTQNRGGHVKVDLFYNMFPRNVQEIATIVCVLLSLALFALITWQSWNIALDNILDGRRFKIIDMPSGYFYLIVPVGGFFMCVELIMEIFEHIATFIKRTAK